MFHPRITVHATTRAIHNLLQATGWEKHPENQGQYQFPVKLVEDSTTLTCNSCKRTCRASQSLLAGCARTGIVVEWTLAQNLAEAFAKVVLGPHYRFIYPEPDDDEGFATGVIYYGKTKDPSPDGEDY